MVTPSKKAEGIESLIDSITPNPKGRRGSIQNNECALCLGPATSFRNELCKKEYTISGMCQKCQDKTFRR